MHPSGRTKLAALHGKDAASTVEIHWYSVYYGLIGVFEMHSFNQHLRLYELPASQRKGLA